MLGLRPLSAWKKNLKFVDVESRLPRATRKRVKLFGLLSSIFIVHFAVEHLSEISRAHRSIESL